MKRMVSGIMLTLLLINMLTLAFDIPVVAPAGSTDYGVVPASDYIDVDVSEAKQMIESNPDLVILDVRTLEEYESGHIENAVLIPVTELEGRLDELDREKDILVYCRTGGRSATASQILVDNGFSSVYNMLGGITAWRNAGYWIEIIHEGDLIIDGTQTLTIENCTYIVRGTIYVEDYGKLFTRNATLMIEQNYADQYGVLVRGGGELEMENTTLDSNFGFGVNIQDQATVTYRNSTIGGSSWMLCSGDSIINVLNSTLQCIENEGQSTVLISDSEILGALGLQFFLPSQVVYLERLKPGFFKYWNLHENQSAFNVLHELTLENSLVNSWAVHINQNPNVTISNSEIADVSYAFCDISITIDGAHSGFYENWTLNKLTLLNTSLGWWGFGFCRCTVEISNLDAGTLDFSDSLAEISNVEVLMQLGGSSNVSVTNSTILLFGACYFTNGGVQLQDTTIVAIGTQFSSFNICGEADFLQEGFGIHPYEWVSSNITRKYGVAVVNGTGDPISDTELSLYDENGTGMWNGATDSFGKANFNVTFSDSNYTDILSLEAVKGVLSATMNVTFLSDTPLILTLPTHDIVISNVTLSKNIVGQGYCISINVTVENQGDIPEDFNLTVYANTTMVDVETVNNMSNGTSTILSFTWNTTDWAEGNYTIWTYATPVVGEIDTNDNNLTDGWVAVTIAGDVDGDFDVDLYDAVKLLVVYGAKKGQSKYDPNCDIDGDGDIDLYDAVRLLTHYGQKHP